MQMVSVDGEALGHSQCLLVATHVRVAQGPRQVVQGGVTDRQGGI